jgi:hypothetical protein
LVDGETLSRVAFVIDSDDEHKEVIGGYFRNFGVTAASEQEACNSVAGEVCDGDIDWSQSKISVDVIERLDSELPAKSGDWHHRGIWYRSGHVYFPLDDQA